MSNARKKLPTKRGLNLLPPDKNYVYFENSDNHPFLPNATKFELLNAWWLADASFLAYTDPEFTQLTLKKAKLNHFKPFKGTSTQGYIAHNESFAIVAFRGTELKSLNSIYDIWTNMQFQQVYSGQGGKIHKGFKNALDEVWTHNDNIKQHLKDLRQAYPKMTFWFTGHSLGAALATIAADRFGFVQGLYTYGSPRVGDTNFRNTFSIHPTLKNNAYRFVNNNDIVPYLPPSSPIEIPFLDVYHHVGNFKYINSLGDISDNISVWNMLGDKFHGRYKHLFTSLDNLKDGFMDCVPVDSLSDHAPIFYAICIWNGYVES